MQTTFHAAVADSFIGRVAAGFDSFRPGGNEAGFRRAQEGCHPGVILIPGDRPVVANQVDRLGLVGRQCGCGRLGRVVDVDQVEEFLGIAGDRLPPLQDRLRTNRPGP